MSGSIYPIVEDWRLRRAERLTTILGDGPGFDFAMGVADAQEVVDQAFYDLASQIADPAGAGHGVLQQLANRWGVGSLSGLTLPESRMVVAGARVGRRSDGSREAVWSTWLAITGAEPGAARLFLLGSSCVWLQAIVQVPPSKSYRERVRRVMLSALPEGHGAHLAWGVASTGVYGSSRYDEARYGWSISITRPEP